MFQQKTIVPKSMPVDYMQPNLVVCIRPNLVICIRPNLVVCIRPNQIWSDAYYQIWLHINGTISMYDCWMMLVKKVSLYKQLAETMLTPSMYVSMFIALTSD